MSNSNPTLDQRRALHAWNAVVEIKNSYKGKKFGGQAKKLPMRIMASGLGQALALLKAKDYSPDLLRALGDWVLDKRHNPKSSNQLPTDDALLRRIIEGDSDSLRRDTDEALSYLQWLNRFAEAEGLTDDEEGDSA